jgi:WD40 repeat protein
MAGGADGTINIWSTADWSLVDKVTDHHGAVASLAISPDQPILASAGDDSVINLWSFEIE